MAALGIRLHPLYQVWLNMRRRCYDVKSPKFQYYGERGIKICPEWNDFECFYAWAMSHGWAPGLLIDRQDNDGDYTPDNCQFVSRKVSANNTSRNNTIIAFGELKTLANWSEDIRCKVQYDTLKYRIRTGWKPEQAITTPSRLS